MKHIRELAKEIAAKIVADGGRLETVDGNHFVHYPHHPIGMSSTVTYPNLTLAHHVLVTISEYVAVEMTNAQTDG